MKALTLIRPWPYAIFHLGKSVENRGWPPPDKVIGQRIAIHAGKKWDEDGYRFILDHVSYQEEAEKMTTLQYLSGAIEGTVVVDSYFHYKDDALIPGRGYAPWAFGPYCWILKDPIELPKSVPCRGYQGLWNVPDKVEHEIAIQQSSMVADKEMEKLENGFQRHVKQLVDSLTPKEKKVLRERFGHKV